MSKGDTFMTETFKVTMLDIPEANIVKENLQQHQCVQRIVRIPPDYDDSDPNKDFKNLWRWIARNKKAVFLGRSGDPKGTKVGVCLLTHKGRPHLQVWVNRELCFHFELMDFESEIEREKRGDGG